LAMLIELHTYARSESIVAGALTGPRAFDVNKNLMVEDMQVFPAGTRIGATYTMTPCVGVRLKGIKQDPRIERPEARGNADWVYIGDVDDEVVSICVWVRRFFKLLSDVRPGPRQPKSPLFLHRDMERPYTYDRLTKDYRELWGRAPSCESPALYGSHSLRVSGYNAARRAPNVDNDLAVAHGGWHGGEERYARFDASQVLAMPAAVWLPEGVVRPRPEDAPVPPPRLLGPRLPLGSARMPSEGSGAEGQRVGHVGSAAIVEVMAGHDRPVDSAGGSTQPASQEGEGSSTTRPASRGKGGEAVRRGVASEWADAPGFPSGWEVRSNTYPSGRADRTFRAPDGSVFKSRWAATAYVAEVAPQSEPAVPSREEGESSSAPAVSCSDVPSTRRAPRERSRRARD
jgi:hypothetical protein